MHGCEFVDQIIQQGRYALSGYCGDAILGPSFLRAETANKRINAEIAELYYGQHTYLANIDSSFYDTQATTTSKSSPKSKTTRW